MPANARPTHLTFDDGTLYIADGEASVIHRLDVSDPCAPAVRPSLVATTSDDPTRVVTTRQLALSPLTLDLKRYLYAIDDADAGR